MVSDGTAEIPGFYYDAAKGKYFKVAAAGNASGSAAAKFSNSQLAAKARLRARSQSQRSGWLYKRYSHLLFKRLGHPDYGAGANRSSSLDFARALSKQFTWTLISGVTKAAIVQRPRRRKRSLNKDLIQGEIIAFAHTSRQEHFSYVDFSPAARTWYCDTLDIQPYRHLEVLPSPDATISCIQSTPTTSLCVCMDVKSGSTVRVTGTNPRSNCVVNEKGSVWAAAVSSRFLLRTPIGGMFDDHCLVYGADNVLHAQLLSGHSKTSIEFDSDIMALDIVHSASDNVHCVFVIGLRNGSVHVCSYLLSRAHGHANLRIEYTFAFGSCVTNICTVPGFKYTLISGLADRLALYDFRMFITTHKKISAHGNPLRREYFGYKNRAHQNHGLAVADNIVAVANDDGTISMFELDSGFDITPPKVKEHFAPQGSQPLPPATCLMLYRFPEELVFYVIQNRSFEMWSAPPLL